MYVCLTMKKPPINWCPGDLLMVTVLLFGCYIPKFQIFIILKCLHYLQLHFPEDLCVLIAKDIMPFSSQEALSI